MLDDVLRAAALLGSAFLFGGMLLFAASFAAFLFKVLPPGQARALIRRAFPPFYTWVTATAAIAAVLALSHDRTSAIWLGLVALTTVPTRQLLMPAINSATDAGKKSRFFVLHGASVLITLAHIAAAGAVLVQLARTPAA